MIPSKRLNVETKRMIGSGMKAMGIERLLQMARASFKRLDSLPVTGFKQGGGELEARTAEAELPQCSFRALHKIIKSRS